MNFKLAAVTTLAAVLTAGASAQSLNGAGATFPNPIYSKWFSEYSSSHPGVQINYQSVGSGAGIRQASSGTVDFGATDGPMTDQQIRESKIKLAHIPTVLGAVVPTYNLPGISGDLKFTGDIIAKIYLGQITNWHDPAIVRINPGVNLPDHQILPVYRADGSGTTYIFTDYLSKVSADFAQRVGHNTSVRWPVGIGQKGNEGVAGLVRGQQFSFGYVELIYAVQNKMEYGVVQNAAGKFIKASTQTVSAAAAGAAKSMPNDFRVSIVNAPGADAYPISSFTWLLIPVQSADPAKGKVLKDFLHWMLDHGESQASALTYAPLPPPVAAKVAAAINNLK